MNKKTINVKTALKQETAVSYLEELVKSIKTGKLVVQQDSDFVSLTPAKTMELEVSASQKKGKEKLTFELTWLTEIAAESDARLLISSKEPVVAPRPNSKDSTPELSKTSGTPKVAITKPVGKEAVKGKPAPKTAGK